MTRTKLLAVARCYIAERDKEAKRIMVSALEINMYCVEGAPLWVQDASIARSKRLRAAYEALPADDSEDYLTPARAGDTG